jgi:hypothetical protein
LLVTVEQLVVNRQVAASAADKLAFAYMPESVGSFLNNAAFGASSLQNAPLGPLDPSNVLSAV